MSKIIGSIPAKKRRIGLGIIAAASTVLLMSACASGSQPAGSPTKSGQKTTSVTLTLNFLACGPNSGFMLAQQKGYYKDAGLDVKIQEGQGSATTASVVAQGNSEFGYADGPAAMQVAAKGGDLEIIAPVLQTNGFSVMSLKDKHINKVSDLVGKSVGVQPGTAQANLFNAVLTANGVDPKSVNVVNIDPSALVGSLLQGRVDAITAGADSQGVQLKDQGADLSQIYYKDAKVPTVGLSLVVQSAWAKAHPDVVKAFVDASLKGWAAAKKDPSAAATAVSSQFPQAGTPEAFQKQLAVDLPLLCAAGAKSLGQLPEKNWTTTYDLLTKYLGLPTTQPVTHYYTTDYLPKDLPSC